MLIIGHRGAAGLASENTLESLKAGLDAGADMLEFDVRLTVDNVPILSHNPRLYGLYVKRSTLADLQTRGNVATLESVLDHFWGRILLNLQLKPMRDINIVYDLVALYAGKNKNDWDNIIFSSFWVRHLTKLRQLNSNINLALLHSINPLAFVTYQRRLQLSAVGWHRLHINSLAIEIAKKAGIFTYVYTINRADAAERLERRGIDGIVTDYPNRLTKPAR